MAEYCNERRKPLAKLPFAVFNRERILREARQREKRKESQQIYRQKYEWLILTGAYNSEAHTIEDINGWLAAHLE